MEQIGVPCRALQNVNDLKPEQAAVVIVNRYLWEEEVAALDAFVRDGGGVLDIGRLLPRLEPKGFRRGRVGSVFSGNAAEESLLCGDTFPLDIHSRVIRRVGGAREALSELDGLISLEARGKGVVASIGFDPGKLMYDSRAVTKRFPGLGGRYPAERVSCISKGELEKLLRQLLTRLYGELGLPFIRKRSFPDDAPSVLSFRIDSDYGSREQIAELYDLARSTKTGMTWFLHVEAHKEWLDKFGGFVGQELALHCMRHRTFPEWEENRANIAEGLAVLGAAGIGVEGFAAPNGIWNHGLGRVIDEQKFFYSSEFSLAYDSLPFRPILPRNRRVNKRFYKALQVPIHPVSVGNLLRVGMNEAQMTEYYLNVIDRKVNAGDPLVFYHHPTHERWGVIEGLLLAAQQRGARNLTFAEYARWWSLREQADVDATFADGLVTVRSRDRDPSVQLEIIAPDGRQGMIVEDGTTNIAHLTPRPALYGNHRLEQPPAIREFSWRLKRRALHDWIIRTSR